MTKRAKESGERIRRMISSGICESTSGDIHVAELKRLGVRAGTDRRIAEKEKFFKALGDSTRLKIVELLAVREMCVCEVMVALGLSQPNASHHLRILEREGIAMKRREGKWILYRLTSSRIPTAIDGIMPRH